MQRDPRLPPAVAPLAPKALQAHRCRVHAVQRGERGGHRGVGGRALPLAELRARGVGVYASLRDRGAWVYMRPCAAEQQRLHCTAVKLSFPIRYLGALSSTDTCKPCTESSTALTNGLRGAVTGTHSNRHLLTPLVRKGQYCQASVVAVLVSKQMPLLQAQ